MKSMFFSPHREGGDDSGLTEQPPLGTYHDPMEDITVTTASTATTATAVPPSPRYSDNLMASYPPQMPAVVMLDTVNFSAALQPALDSMRSTPVVTEAAPAPSSAAAAFVCPSIAEDDGMGLDMGMSLGDPDDDGLPSMRMDDMDVDASEQAGSWARSSTDHVMSPSDSLATPTPPTRERGGGDLVAATFTKGTYEHAVGGVESVLVMQLSGGGREESDGGAGVDVKERSEVDGGRISVEQSLVGGDSVERAREEQTSPAGSVGGHGDGDGAEQVDNELLALDVLSHDAGELGLGGAGQQPAPGSEFMPHHRGHPEGGGEENDACHSGPKRDHEPSKHYDDHQDGQTPQQQPQSQEEEGRRQAEEEGGEGELREEQVEEETNGGDGFSSGGDDAVDDVRSTLVHAEAAESAPAHVQPTSPMRGVTQPAETPGGDGQTVNLQQQLSLDNDIEVKVEPEDKDDDDVLWHVDSPPENAHRHQQQEQHMEGGATATASTVGANTAAAAAAVGRTFNGRFCRRDIDEAGVRAAAAKGRTLSGRFCRSNIGEAKQAGGTRSSGSEKFSQYRGVRWLSDKDKWVTEVKAFGKVRYYAEFDDEEKAARAYDREVQKDLATPTLNFPDDVEHENESEAGTLTDSSDDDDDNEEEEEEEEDKEEAGVRGGRGSDGGGAFEVKKEKPSTPAVRRKSCGGASASSHRVPAGKTSMYRGVCKTTGKWWVRLRIDSSGKELRLGPFGTEVKAAKAYDEAAKEHHPNPVLNFKSNGSLNPDRHTRWAIWMANNRNESSNAKKSSSSSSSSATTNRASAASSSNKRHHAEKQPVNGRSHPRYRGVYRRSNGWVGLIHHKGEKRTLGHFKTDTEAARAYDRAAKELHGDAAVLNLGRREKKSGESAATTGAKAPSHDSKKRKRYSSDNEADTTTTTTHTTDSPPPSPGRPPKRACTQSVVSYAPPSLKGPLVNADLKQAAKSTHPRPPASTTITTQPAKATAHTHPANFRGKPPAKPVGSRSSSCTTTTRAGTTNTTSTTKSTSSSSKPCATTTSASSATAAKLASAREKQREKEEVARATKKARGVKKDTMQSDGAAAPVALTSSTSSPPPPSSAPAAAASAATAEATALPLHQTQHATESGAATASLTNDVKTSPLADRDLVAELRAAVMAAWADAEESEWGKYSRAAAPLVQSQEAKQSVRLFLHGLLGSNYSKIDMTKPQDRDRVVRMYLMSFEAGAFSA